MNRVAGLDSANLERAVRQIVRKSFESWRSGFPPVVTYILERIRNEILLVADTIMWSARLTGQEIHYCYSSVWRLVLHFMLTVVRRYISNSVISMSNNMTGTIDRLSAAYRLTNLMNFLYFCCRGGYGNVAEMITRPKMKSPKRTLGIFIV
ncbi:unnamed protein product [Gongylonema pulchrum]|uniref:Uncharacterized protein n=1 Tax=Gongylonema pulchrum TaxID=637853 RepID=A0A3P6P574_9BILA|nr:unnamed protein product [Gongylonema pulchrum]